MRCLRGLTRRLSPAEGVLRLAAIVAGISAAGCASHRFVPPVGPGQPVPLSEARAIWREATALCSGVRTYNAEIRPSGRVAGARVGGRLLLAVDADGRIGLEAVAGGPPLFVLKGRTDEAVLWLPRENRVIQARPDEILGRLVGLQLEPARLLSLFAGCLAGDLDVQRAERLGESMRLTTGDAVVYLVSHDGRWQLRAGEFASLVADYREFEAATPRVIGIRSLEGRPDAVDLVLTVEYRVLNPTLPSGAFTANVPATAVPASVEDLRPLGGQAD